MHQSILRPTRNQSAGDAEAAPLLKPFSQGLRGHRGHRFSAAWSPWLICLGNAEHAGESAMVNTKKPEALEYADLAAGVGHLQHIFSSVISVPTDLVEIFNGNDAAID